jgi:hypothetical protein
MWFCHVSFFPIKGQGSWKYTYKPQKEKHNFVVFVVLGDQTQELKEC